MKFWTWGVLTMQIDITKNAPNPVDIEVIYFKKSYT